jgi:hypothetical protein
MNHRLSAHPLGALDLLLCTAQPAQERISFQRIERLIEELGGIAAAPEAC